MAVVLVRAGDKGAATQPLASFSARQPALVPSPRRTRTHSSRAGVSASSSPKAACPVRCRRPGGRGRGRFRAAVRDSNASASTNVAADVELLQELRTRVTRPPACAPNCVSTDRMKITVTGGRLVIEAHVSAGTLSAFPVPGPSSNWVPGTVAVDGASADGLALLEQGFLYLRVPAGQHLVRLEGPLARDSLTLAFGVAPHHLEVQAEGWEVEGVHEDGRTSDSVQLRRVLRSADAEHQDDQLPAWLQVTRVLQIGVRWTLRSSARRLTEGAGPALVRVPASARRIGHRIRSFGGERPRRGQPRRK